MLDRTNDESAPAPSHAILSSLSSRQRRDNRQSAVKVQAGIAALTVLTVLGITLATRPAPDALPSVADRLAYVARLAVLPALALLAGIGAVAATRFSGPAFDPLATPDRGRLLVHQRYLSNTLEQLPLHLVALVGLAVDGSVLAYRLLPGLVVCFTLGRLLFWAGYLRSPMRRGLGFAMTFQPTAIALGYLTVRLALTTAGLVP